MNVSEYFILPDFSLGLLDTDMNGKKLCKFN